MLAKTYSIVKNAFDSTSVSVVNYGIYSSHVYPIYARLLYA